MGDREITSGEYEAFGRAWASENIGTTRSKRLRSFVLMNQHSDRLGVKASEFYAHDGFQDVEIQDARAELSTVLDEAAPENRKFVAQLWVFGIRKPLGPSSGSDS